MKLIDFETWLKNEGNYPKEKMLREGYGDRKAYEMICQIQLLDFEEPLLKIYTDETKIRNPIVFSKKYNEFAEEVANDTPSEETKKILQAMEKKLGGKVDDIKKYMNEIYELRMDFYKFLNEGKKKIFDKGKPDDFPISAYFQSTEQTQTNEGNSADRGE